jgi:hypothetical protein
MPEVSQQISEKKKKYGNIKFHENLSCGSQVARSQASVAVELNFSVL